MISRKTSAVFAVLSAVTAAVLTYVIVSGVPANAVAADADEGFASNVEVVETMNSGGYTYVRVKTDSGVVWAAGPQTEVEVGDRVNLGDGMLMSDFHSATLDQTFDEIYFVGSIEVVGGGSAAPAMGMGHGGAQASETVEIGKIAKAEGGSTIAELYASRTDLAGKEVVVRGRVVKYTPGIMGRNWIHIQDGSGEAGSNDLAVTTDGTTKIGDLILVRGTAAIDKDFGAGYSYDLIVEQASITVE
jgi:hypothetical protein